ncbi:MAG TPA: hypothetical protein VMS18_19485 [Candidatus Binatia bacterium]|nr:hypothetical protein [Candidatus Binatia bacterium]
MKKHAVTLLILSVVFIPGLLSAQSACVMDAQTGNRKVLVTSGGQRLTQMQADCALELIDFMAAAARGVDLIQVDEPMRQIWRGYLVNVYPKLPQEDRTFLANAPMMFYNVNVTWPRLTPAAQNKYRQSWAAVLPPVLEFIQPVVAATRQQESLQVAGGQGPGSSYGSVASQPSDPAADYRRQQAISNSLAVHNSIMTNNTINLMNSFSHMDGH